MVFESVVVDVLNRFLGDYVVNLDSSQLSLGIWGGDAILRNLEIKENALSQLDIPFKVRAGHIGRLELKIPWKKLYTQSVEATLDEVYLLIVPTASIKYDAEKEERQLQEARQRELQRIEESKQKAAEKEKQDTFVEKLVTQVIKNLQVKISNIHVRYEDDVNQLCVFASVFRPISANAKLRMNPRSDVDFSSPKVDLVVNLPEVAVELSRPQYVSILELLGSVDMMTRNLPYRKYRPDEAVHTNAHQWQVWRYVITGVLEVNVKPRLHMWSWEHIRHHRQHVKKYREIYKSKITSKKPAESLLKELEVHVKHHTPDLYFCLQFENMKINFQLNRLSLSIKESREKAEIIKLSVIDLKAMLTQRPAAQAIKISALLSSFEVSGLPRGKSAPILLSPRHVEGMKDTTLLNLMFETNPLDASADQRLRIESQPLEIIYDAMTVNSMSAFFMPPKDLQLDELTNATLMKLEQFRDKTSTGLMYIIETQKVLDLKINLMASYVIVPENGFYDPKHNLAILDLGHFQSRSDLPQLSAGSSTIEDIMSRAYDSFDVQLSSLQFLYTKAGGDWKRARPLRQSAFHILEPVDLKVVFSRAMVVTDSRMPKFKISGELPLLSLRISDDKVRGVLALLSSIPLPESRPATQTRVPQVTPKVVIRMLIGVYKLFVYFCEDSEDKNVHLITTLDNTEEDLLTLEYVKVNLLDHVYLSSFFGSRYADKNAPDFKTMYKNTEQLIKVNFSSLDVHLHTEALLNSINFLNNLLPPLKKEAQEEQPILPKEEEEEEEEAKIEDSAVTKKSSSKKSKFEDVVNLHIRADLSCLNVFIRGEKARISEISIEGLVSEVQMKKKSIEILANLKNIVILDCDKEALYKKAVSIADKEVFDFRMMNYVDATEGDAYTDMHIVDTSVTLTVGCIQVIFLNKFVSSILAFINNFQEAKNALAEVTAQAAEKAATGVLELAERSTRISLDVDIKAPVVFLPQSSVSQNVIVADLGLVTVKNHFEIVSSPTHTKIPPVMDIMAVGLSDLKMYRSEIQLLKPVNMDLSIKRNLSATWYHSIPDIQINAHLKPMSVSAHLCFQEDLTIVLKTLSENLSETSEAPPAPSSSDKGDLLQSVCVQIQLSDSRDESLKLAEFTLGTISTAVHMFSDSSMKASLKLTNCLLDDKRQRGREGDVMVDVSYRQGRDGTVLDTLVQDLYLCASMEFLLTVANVFLKAMADGFSGPPKNNKPTNNRAPMPHKSENMESAAVPVVAKTEMNIVVKNPEIVFVADLTRAEAPALVMTTQCELVMKNEPSGQSMMAAISDLKVVACPLLREKREHNVTTVLQPCQVFFESTQSPTSPQTIRLSISSLTLKVSPIIINTVITIQSALSPAAETPEELESPVPQDLWERRNLRDLKLWFLEEEEEKVTQSVIPLVPHGESLKMNIDSICLTLEAGVGHRTVPMLLAKASFQGDVKNWSTLINLHCHLDLEVREYCNTLYTYPDHETLDSAFAEATKQTAECFQTDQAPFVVKNNLGLPVSVLHSEVFRIIGKESKNRVVELQDGESLNMDYTLTAETSDQFSAMTSLSAKNYIQPSKTHLTARHSSQIHTAIMDFSTLELKLLGYLQQDWESKYSLCSDCEEISFIKFRSLRVDEETEAKAELDIAVHVKKEEGQVVVAVHSPYWMVNKTGRLLQYKADDLHRKHAKDYDMPLLFSFKPRNFLQNNKIRLMISESELSDDFSIDTVGSYGDVKCKGKQKDYMVGVKIDATSFSLTRLVTFLPFYMLVNRTKHIIRVCEEGLDQWTEAAVPFWPEKDSKKLRVKVEGSQSSPRAFFFHQPENCLLLHLDKTLGGIIVDVNLTEHSAVIRFSDYHDGAAPFLLINHTKDETLQFHQSSQAEMDELAPGQAVYYTWAEPTGSRILSWKWGKYKGELKSEEGKFFVISFYEGLQRVVLFTTELCVFKKIYDNEKMELAEQETCISLQNMGISLVNNTSSQEVAFIGITRYCWGSWWHTSDIKKSYVCFNPSLAVLNVHQVMFAANGVDMRIMQPFDAPLRRNFLPALKVEYSVSTRQKTYRVQINRIQIQNQLPGAIFPFVFYPIKPPKSVSMDSEPKPLADVSIITRAAGHSDILRIKYFKMLIQEMDLRIDLGFLYAILELFTAEHAMKMKKDIDYLKTELNHSSATDTSPISLYEYFHISPIKLHLSFSLSTGGEDGNKKERETEVIPVQSLNLLLKSIGATLTDAQDVLFKLAFFELTYQFRTTQQLQSEVIRHYSKQAIKQMYVLVLGLDVLGNPFGLIRGLSEGVEAFFYEPYQGAIQGPEEFVEGMALGVKALVGGAVGGLAGAASRITGAMAKGVAAMTMDEEYQQKRREAMNKQPSGLREGLTRGGKGLGFVSGITGIVTKPIKGAQREGAAGFFKGVGKGLVGALTRPTGGIIDMASSTFQGIKRAAETSQDVESLRPPRFIHEDGVIRPYKEREGIGSQMLQVMHDTSLPADTLLVFKKMAMH
uniref:Vacuolar protein sorting 13 homolog A n=1 Tax=Cyprinus carpio TaxID=7962 RepID=A0A8C1ZR47_CYPCA